MLFEPIVPPETVSTSLIYESPMVVEAESMPVLPEVTTPAVSAESMVPLRYDVPDTVSAVEDAKPRVEEAETLIPLNDAPPVKVGLAEKTTLPVPVSSVRSAANSAEVSIEVDETLLLKLVQSAVARQPTCAAVAVSQFKVLVLQVRPVPSVIRVEGVL